MGLKLKPLLLLPHPMVIDNKNKPAANSFIPCFPISVPILLENYIIMRGRLSSGEIEKTLDMPTIN